MLGTQQIQGALGVFNGALRLTEHHVGPGHRRLDIGDVDSAAQRTQGGGALLEEDHSGFGVGVLGLQQPGGARVADPRQRTLVVPLRVDGDGFPDHAGVPVGAAQRPAVGEDLRVADGLGGEEAGAVQVTPLAVDADQRGQQFEVFHGGRQLTGLRQHVFGDLYGVGQVAQFAVAAAQGHDHAQLVQRSSLRGAQPAERFEACRGLFEFALVFQALCDAEVHGEQEIPVFGSRQLGAQVGEPVKRRVRVALRRASCA
ncbi:hypothetical protein [Streptomyces sp. NBC_00268]|uniref:hypothetical protein n=1 Tax=Streptomyces sp. NBC_00268 TaxID=2975695 RepID=UPI002255DC37|nr:hypothetical protein [Streptomyces sp. NBC_00268]MCX5182881.1 hypothetical protein [Streptomyces sp. NBC_00268]